jgi:hypothetical protein
VTSSDDHLNQLVTHQLAMNHETLASLRRHGVTDRTELRLDFAYRANNRESASALMNYLTNETDYDIRLRQDNQGDWWVEGATQPTAVGERVLNDWVCWMVTAGHENGSCDFDGWGAAVPKNKPQLPS